MEQSVSQSQSSEYDKQPSLVVDQILKDLNLPLEYPDYSSVDYWNSRYSRTAKQQFEWLQPYSTIRSFVHKQLQGRFEIAKVLYIGCGNSNLGNQLVGDGIKSVECIDFSDVLIRQMMHSNIPYLLMDCCNKLSYSDNTIDLIIDKGLMDSVMCGDGFYERIKCMLKECRRVLKQKGVLMILSQGHPDTRMMYIKDFHIAIHEIKKIKIEQFDDLDHHFLYVCTKQ